MGVGAIVKAMSTHCQVKLGTTITLIPQVKVVGLVINKVVGLAVLKAMVILPSQTRAHHKRVVNTSESSESYGYLLPRAQHHIGPTLRIASESSSEDTIGSYVGPTRRFKSSRRRSQKNKSAGWGNSGTN